MCNNKDATAIFAGIKAFLKSALNQIYLRQSMVETSAGKSSEEQVRRQLADLTLDQNSANLPTGGSGVRQQLPRFVKFLLVSAYIAAHNPPKHDKRLFETSLAAAGGKSRRSRYTVT